MHHMLCKIKLVATQMGPYQWYMVSYMENCQRKYQCQELKRGETGRDEWVHAIKSVVYYAPEITEMWDQVQFFYNKSAIFMEKNGIKSCTGNYRHMNVRYFSWNTG